MHPRPSLSVIGHHCTTLDALASLSSTPGPLTDNFMSGQGQCSGLNHILLGYQTHRLLWGPYENIIPLKG